jgi:plastocyanin
MLVLAAPAAAVHLFPATPAFDPLGHDCAQSLVDAPEESGAQVDVVGFSFVDGGSRTSTSTIDAGQTVSWTWLADHCHSVTFADGRGTQGTDGFMPEQPELVRVGDGGDSFVLTFDMPGTYTYQCVHHATVGMTGVVEVAAASQEGGGEPPPAEPGDEAAASEQPASSELPATGGARRLAYVVGAASVALGLLLLLRQAVPERA